MASQYIGDCEVGKDPRVVSVVWGNSAHTWAKESKKKGADLLEVRCDLYKADEQNTESIADSLKKIQDYSGLPTIVTMRPFIYGGLYEGSEAARQNFLKSLIDIPHAHAVDVEVNAGTLREAVSTYAKQKGKALIISYHNDFDTPSIPELESIADSAIDGGADIVKIGVHANGYEDVKRLFHFTLTYDKGPVATISTGLLGKVSRMVFPFFGSCLSYGYIEKKVDPGQLSVENLKKFLTNYDTRFISNSLSSFRKESLEQMVDSLPT